MVKNNFPDCLSRSILAPEQCLEPGYYGMEVYAADLEEKMPRCFGWLSEKDRRRYAAVEAAKLGHGGVEYIARILACEPTTMRQGLPELEETADAAAGRSRQHGGGARRAPSRRRP